MNPAPAVPGELILTTPEHVSVPFVVADLGSRATAVLVDLALQLLALLALAWLLFGALAWASRELLPAFLLLAFFVVRNFYFPIFEVRWQGRTPGKRALGLRVVARDGGPLATDLVFARNLTRELETFLPLSVLLAPEDLLSEAPGWARIATAGWILALTLLPLFNRQRARLGDLLAGTVVVVEPKVRLLEDLVAEARSGGADAEHTFTAEELDIYGIRELQVLEDLLRREPSPQKDDMLALVARKIHRKLGRELPSQLVPERFLQSFYAAQRARLEGKLLLGKRRERKVR